MNRRKGKTMNTDEIGWNEQRTCLGRCRRKEQRRRKRRRRKGREETEEQEEEDSEEKCVKKDEKKKKIIICSHIFFILQKWSISICVSHIYYVKNITLTKTIKKRHSKRSWAKEHFSRGDIWVHGVVSILDLTRTPCWLESWQSYTLLAKSTRW